MQNEQRSTLAQRKAKEERTNGLRFELWLAELLRQKEYLNVLHHVEFHRSPDCFREVDVSYNVLNNEKLYHVLVEAKYRKSWPVQYALRKRKRKNGSSEIFNLVDEVAERQQFVGADLSIIVTNSTFDEQMQEEAPKKGIKLVDGSWLQSTYERYGGKGSIEDSIASVEVHEKGHKNVIYLNPVVSATTAQVYMKKMIHHYAGE
ncbi:restriction endonuclease [Candidatus Woesearchaeota archaeon]|nr:restriction endonuclease [Candidatus Woesearchaeota archaeon]